MKEFFTSRKALIFLAVGIFLIGALPSVYFYQQYQKAQVRLKDPASAAEQETRDLVARVGKLIELPEEEPTVASVSDVEKLRDQPFFTRAANGDKVLIFTNAKKAVLYRPSINKIIDVGPVTIGPTATASGQTAAAETEKYTVVLRNGTSLVGLTKKYGDVLGNKAPNLTVTDRENAQRADYTKSILVDIKGTQSELTSQLARALDITIDTLPKGEATPAADFLIILGTDQQ